jgi:hypothetical protein
MIYLLLILGKPCRFVVTHLSFFAVSDIKCLNRELYLLRRGKHLGYISYFTLIIPVEGSFLPDELQARNSVSVVRCDYRIPFGVNYLLQLLEAQGDQDGYKREM